ncbi:hypothetical protein TSIB_1485 [Thermococcus sibiricus MM 739]|uniref:Uncharacterized protein n=1 Tax=Thermococcus sibiricus (strain DSM 12597 / MM 739) TaxID=604354 RepID=C6A4J1_THESM|nr:hypothetical protein TSIB_1485 [Thermococcus sibiricus MM 739]
MVEAEQRAIKTFNSFKVLLELMIRRRKPKRGFCFQFF